MSSRNDPPYTTDPFSRCLPGSGAGTSASRHFCQIHHSETSLLDAIVHFTTAGLNAGENVFLLAPETRQAGIFDRLREQGMTPEALAASGRLNTTRPADLRELCLRNGVLDRAAYRRAIDAIFEQYDAGVPLRIYGELSNALWHEGDAQTAALLDELFDEYLEGRCIPVFCGYLFDGLAQSSYRPELERLCRVHCCMPATPEDERLRAAVDAASIEVLGIPLSVALNRAPSGDENAWSRLPLARRTVVWLQSNMPGAMIRVLDLARAHFR